MVSHDLQERIRRVKLVIMDNDGVLTDGRIVLGDYGDELKFFDIQDGLGLVLLERAGLNAPRVLAQRGQELAPPQPDHADEPGRLQAMARGMVRADPAPAAVRQRHQGKGALRFEANLHLGALAGREVDGAPLERQAARRLPGRDTPGLHEALGLLETELGNAHVVLGGFVER